MKNKLILIIVLLFSTLAVISSADYSDTDTFMEENSFTIASFNGTKTFIDNAKNPMAIEDAVWWLISEKDTTNLKYVSVLGQLSGGSTYNYGNTIAKGMTSDEMLKLCADDDIWKKEFRALAGALSPLTDEGIPVGVSLDVFDYAGNGYSRQSMQSEFLAVESIMPQNVTFEYYDDSNYYTIVENNGINYIIFQLELWPRTEALNWFNSVILEHQDKRAVIYTTSFIDDNGDMYTMWDWENDSYPPLFGTTYLRKYSMTWAGKPRDGISAWNWSFSKYDNILAVVSSKITSDKIITSKITNDRGVEVAAIAANADNGMYISQGATVLLMKISEDNTEITCAWAVPFKGILDSSVKTIKLEKLGELEEPVMKTELPKISPQFNGANTAYIFGKGNNKFEPNANMTRAEACTIFARLILGTSNIPSDYTTRFTDVKNGDWFYNAVAFLDETGYFHRNTNTVYKPNEPITRAEFVDLANSASTLVSKNNRVKFGDVPTDHFYYESIIAAAESGLVNGYEDSSFRPDNTITRAEVVTVINRLLGLRVSEKTVSESHLENEFDDIKGHWSRLNILMASNSRVHGDYYYRATLDGVSESASEITFTNKHFSFSLSKKNGKATKAINLYTGEDVLKDGGQFLYLSTATGNKVLPTSLSLDGNRIKISFKDGIDVYMIVEVEDNWMSFEIDSEIPKTLAAVTFGNLSTKITPTEDDNSFMLNGMGMTAWVNPVNKGFRANATSTIAHAYTKFDAGTMGSKFGIVFSKRGDALKYLQELTDAIDPSVGLKSVAGGAYAQEWEGNFGDYIIITDTTPETLENTIKLATELDVEQIDIHHRTTTFRQGDMYFYHTETGSAKEYYEKIGKRFEDAGFDTGLHTYAYYISYTADSLLSDPKWQRDLETLETYTLRKNISKFRVNIPTNEDATDFNTTVSFFLRNSRYILIDEEIIYVGKGTTDGFINVKRAQCGTVAQDHNEGATVYHLSGYFNMFAPKLGSELFYHIADLTAKAYNEGGFDMLYLDAIDGIGAHLENSSDQFYYFQMFLHRIVSQCEKTPIVETSSSAPQEWNVRARTGAWDTPTRAIKRFIGNHVDVNLTTIKTNMTPTLGWFSFLTDKNDVAGMKNTISKSLFHDDLDYLGMNALIYNMSIVYGDCGEFFENPFYAENVRYYQQFYAKLRKSHYFSEKSLEKVKAIGGEWKVFEKNPGEYAFLQMHYEKANLGMLSDGSDNSFKANNPFAAQTPFIRIESRYSTLFENEMLVAEFDESKAIGDSVSKNIKLDLTSNMAVKVRVKGTGTDGDAMLISLTGGITSGESGGRGDWFIDLNFTGWKEFVFIDIDNAEYDTDKYEFSGIGTDNFTYVTYRRMPNYADIINLTVRTCGKSGKNASIGNIYAYAQTASPVKNPTVTVGGQKITFNTEISGGEYLEFDPLTGKATLYHNLEQTKENISYTGSLSVPKGDFDVTYTANASTDAHIRAKVVLGFAGEEITN